MPHKSKAYRLRKMNIYFLSEVAWNFAYALLWSDLKFSDEEIEEVKEQLISYFYNAPHRKRAFISFCERIILTRNYLIAKKDAALPAPAIWLNPDFHQGFPETKSWYQAIEQTRKHTPGHLKHYTVMANHYYLYVLKPAPSIISQCRAKLLELKAKSLLELFYNAIAQLNQNPKP